MAPAPGHTLPSIRPAVVAAAAVMTLAPTALPAVSHEPAEPTAAPPSTATTEPSARVQLAVKPWAEVALDGNALGTTPLSPITLAPGVHTFEFTHPDYRPFRRRVTLRAGEEIRLQVDFDTVGVPLK
jgi:hypothetical protein